MVLQLVTSIRETAISQLAAIAMSAIIIILVAFVAYTFSSMNSGSNAAGTRYVGTASQNMTGVTTFGTTVSYPTSTTIYSGSQNSSTQTPSSEETFNYATMPRVFRLGDYNFAIIYNGTGYEYSANGTAYMNMGFSFALNVTSLQTGSSETVDFGWAPPAPQPYSLPTPSNASLFNGAVQMHWNSNATGKSGTFLTIWILSNIPPSTSTSTTSITNSTISTIYNITTTRILTKTSS